MNWKDKLFLIDTDVCKNEKINYVIQYALQRLISMAVKFLISLNTMILNQFCSM